MLGKLTCICKSPSFDISKLPFSRYPLALVQYLLPLHIKHCCFCSLRETNYRIKNLSGDQRTLRYLCNAQAFLPFRLYLSIHWKESLGSSTRPVSPSTYRPSKFLNLRHSRRFTGCPCRMTSSLAAAKLVLVSRVPLFPCGKRCFNEGNWFCN